MTKDLERRPAACGERVRYGDDEVAELVVGAAARAERAANGTCQPRESRARWSTGATHSWRGRHAFRWRRARAHASSTGDARASSNGEARRRPGDRVQRQLRCCHERARPPAARSLGLAIGGWGRTHC